MHIISGEDRGIAEAAEDGCAPLMPADRKSRPAPIFSLEIRGTAGTSNDENSNNRTVVWMQYAKMGDYYLLRLERGEEVIDKLTSFVREHGIKAGMVSGIGAVSDITLGYFDPDSRDYHKELLPGSYEVANIAGNVSVLAGEEMLHLHATIADNNHNGKAGHLFSAEVSVTLEVVIVPFPGAAERRMDETVGLNLLELA